MFSRAVNGVIDGGLHLQQDGHPNFTFDPQYGIVQAMGISATINKPGLREHLLEQCQQDLRFPYPMELAISVLRARTFLQRPATYSR